MAEQLELLPTDEAPKWAKSAKRGYAKPPGTGPVGVTCRDCKHSYRMEIRSGVRFWKCDLVKHTSGQGTDILRDAPACSEFEVE